MKYKNDLRPEASSRWLEKARHDSDTAFLNHRHGGYTDVTCYFSHQTIEKSLFEKICKDLDTYYIETRYPLDVPIVYTKKEANQAFKKAENVYNFVKAKLNF